MSKQGNLPEAKGPKSRFVAQWIDQFLREQTIRANSLIITVYGDAIAPHGGSVWLGSFIKLVESLGLNDRMVRTSVFRLVKDRWLVAQQIGRRSYYSLTPTGRRRFEHAYRRIYFQPRNQWEGDWQVVLATNSILPNQREAMRKELLWEGFGVIAPGVLAHPSANTESLYDILQGTGVLDQVVVLRAKSLGSLTAKPLRDLVRECWNLEAVAADYKRYLDRFRPLWRALKNAKSLDPEQCFVVRMLLMHEFRRVLLRDPQLPDQLLPEDWPGALARQLCRDIYVLTQRQAEQHLMSVLETATGQLPEAAPYFYERFGGLDTGDEERAAAASEA
ncbi:MAG: phenylacetic acid degradation operon negative regulatory protein PaaX [Pseudomonadota bacterium]